MAGNLTTVTAAIARTALPTVPRLQSNDGAAIGSTGNPTSAGGQGLPAVTVPRVDNSQVIQQLNAFVEDSQRSLRFSVDDATGRTVMTVVNANTQEVIRQVPEPEKLALARNLDSLRGLLIDASV